MSGTAQPGESERRRSADRLSRQQYVTPGAGGTGGAHGYPGGVTIDHGVHGVDAMVCQAHVGHASHPRRAYTVRMTRLRTASALMAALLVVAGCASDAPDSTATVSATPSPSRTTAPTPPSNPRPDVIWPLTGEDATEADREDLALPAVSVKIENSTQARPQSNLAQADIVFEEYVEYGISRLIAVYHSTVPDSVGPIRSLRPMDQNIIGSLEGPLVFSGAQGRFINSARSSGLTLIAQDTGATGFFRTTDKPAPHNLHGRMADFLAQSGDLTTPPEQWQFAYPAEESTVVTQGEQISEIDITMSQRANPRWEWDADQDAWLRYEGGSAHATAEGARITATNVVMLWVDVRYTDSNGGSSVPETIVVTDAGTGYVASGDRLVEVTWSKAGQFDPYVILGPDGEEVSLMPGQTWVELVPQSGVGHSTSIDVS